MSDNTGRYPLSTADGKAIPLDTVRPAGIVKKSFLSASGSAAISIPTTVSIVSAYATEDCYIKFATAAATITAPVDGVLLADTIFVPASSVMVFTPPVDKRSIAIIGDSANGSLILSYLETWNGLSMQSQTTRR